MCNQHWKRETIVRKDQLVLQSLKEKTNRYFVDLENRGIISKSVSNEDPRLG